MAEAKQIDLYRAIEEMKEISARGGTFSLRFRKWRPKASDERVSNASYKLFFTDTDTGRALNCWQCLIMEFNGLRTVLN